jgi:hypothetical protein
MNAKALEEERGTKRMREVIPHCNARRMQRTTPDLRDRTKKEAAMSPWRP